MKVDPDREEESIEDLIEDSIMNDDNSELNPERDLSWERTDFDGLDFGNEDWD